MMSTPFPSPSSDDLEALMTGYVLNTLSDAEVEEFERDLRADPKLKQQVQKHQEMMGLLAHAAPSVAAPAHLKNRILEAAASLPKERSASQPSANQRNGWKRGISLAAAGLLLALGISAYWIDRQLRLLDATLTALKGEETYVFAMRGHQTAKTASGSVILDLEAGKAIVVLQNLPPLPAGEVYTLWANTLDKKIFCGQFRATTARTVEQLAIPKAAYTSSAQSMQIFSAAAATPTQQNSNRLVMVSHSPT